MILTRTGSTLSKNVHNTTPTHMWDTCRTQMRATYARTHSSDRHSLFKYLSHNTTVYTNPYMGHTQGTDAGNLHKNAFNVIDIERLPRARPKGVYQIVFELHLGCRVQGAGFSVQCLVFRVQAKCVYQIVFELHLGCRGQGAGFSVQGLVFRPKVSIRQCLNCSQGSELRV